MRWKGIVVSAVVFLAFLAAAGAAPAGDLDASDIQARLAAQEAHLKELEEKAAGGSAGAQAPGAVSSRSGGPSVRVGGSLSIRSYSRNYDVESSLGHH